MTHLKILREGQGPSLLLLHGIGGSCTVWSKQIELLRADFSCIAPDLPGYGDSPDPKGQTLESLVDEIATVLGGEAVHVVGVSFGGLAALMLAHRHPELVCTLTLADATLGRANLPDEARDRWLQGRIALAQDLGARSLERAAEIASPSASPEAIEEIARHMRRARPAGYIAVAKAIASTDARPWLNQIDIPTLIICGEDDAVTGLAMSNTLSEELPNSRLVRIPAAGHAPHVEQPAEFAAAIRAFLSDRLGRA